MPFPHPLHVLRNASRRIRSTDERTTSMEVEFNAARTESSGEWSSLRTAVDELRTELTQVEARLTQVLAATAEEAAAAGHHRHAEVRDTVNLAAFRETLRPGPTRVVFLVHHIEAWDGLHDIVELMRASTDFQPVVVSIPRKFNGSPGLEHEAETSRGLTARGVPHLRLDWQDEEGALRLLKTMDPDLVFRQSQWDADVPYAFSTDRLTFARLCLIPYETMNLIQNPAAPGTRNTAVDSDYHRRAWAVFCANDLVLAAARSENALGGTQFHVVGHPKADRLAAATADWPIAPSASSPSRRVVWSAHHSIGDQWSRFGRFPRDSEHMLEWARQDPDTQFLFMPHPALVPFTSSSDSPVSRSSFDAWLTRWDSLPNTSALLEGEYRSVLAATDILLTDGLSMLVEHQLLQKPVIFLERPGHLPFNEAGEIVMTGVHRAADVASARLLTAELLASGDPLRHQQRQNSARLFGDPGAAHRVMAVLRSKIQAEATSLPDTRALTTGFPPMCND